MNFFIQMIGIVAWGLITISYWQKKKIGLLVLQLVAYILYAIHFALLGGFSGALCNIIGIVLLLLIFMKEKSNKKHSWIIFLILLMYLPVGLYFYEGLYTILPVIASIISLVSNWQKNIVIIKLGGIIGSLCWLVYGLFVFSFSSLITNIIFIVSTIVSLLVNKKFYI